MTRFLRRLHQLSGEHWLRSWARFRWADLVVSIHWLYDRAPESWLLDLAATMQRQGVDWVAHVERLPVRDRALPEERDLSSHVVNNAMGLKAPGVWFRQSGDPVDRNATRTAVATYDRYHGQATGVFTGDEHLAGRNPSQGTELCAVVEYMYSLETLIPILGESWLADRLELIAFNALPATFSPDMWAHQYVQQVNQVICAVSEDRVYTSNGPDANIFGLEPHFGCCTANMHQGWPKFAANTWLKNADGGLAAVTLTPGAVSTVINGVPVTVDVASDYPFKGEVTVTVTAERPLTFPLDLRIPEWADGATIGMDGASTTVQPGAFNRVEREWSGTTIITLDLPLNARLEQRDHGSVSLLRGPLLFALPIGEDWQYLKGEHPHADWEVHPTTPWNYALIDPEMALATLQFDTAPVESPFAPDTAPVSCELTARRIDGWAIEHNAAGPLPESPVDLDSAPANPPETICLIPYGSTNLRIAQFPVTSS